MIDESGFTPSTGTEKVDGYEAGIITSRASSSGAEYWLGREIKVHTAGFVYLVDYMGNDAAIAQAARVSYGTGTKSTTDDAGLIRYLLRNKHTSPFEMCELKFHVKMPIFVARQLIRHRTASLNEYSARYSVLDKEFYFPELEVISAQSTTNNQGREDKQHIKAEQARHEIVEISEASYSVYEWLLDNDVSRELSRMVIPTNIYTQMYWKVDLHNLLHFLRLRMDSHAQKEIRDYANAIAYVVRDSYPAAWQAFEDYVLNSMTFSAGELEVLKSFLNVYDIKDDLNYVKDLSKREQDEFIAKINKIMGGV